MSLSILYRGPLASCNYGCHYCPFAKRTETRSDHDSDRDALERFVDWVAGRDGRPTSVFFTPWGEALVHRRYQRALVSLSRMAHVQRAAIQTNLSGRLDWTSECDLERLALWTTYHPTEVPRRRFLAACRELVQRGVRFSVGAVGLREHAGEIEALRAELPAEVYLWINAYKDRAGYYVADDLRRFAAIDPLFPLNARRHPSRGRACEAGHSVVAVDGDGTARRCHFLPRPIGNIYDPDFEAALRPRPCTRDVCGCHIGYVHMPALGLHETFGDGLLERIPAGRIW
jgi:MoaA/NifB/PqqE/SkfB family radical SAM enzyme